MEDKKTIIIEEIDGTQNEVELVTYLIDDENQKKYIVYSKGEIQGSEEDQVIYISRIVEEGDILKLEEIIEDAEWSKVQQLLKRIANAN